MLDLNGNYTNLLFFNFLYDEFLICKADLLIKMKIPFRNESKRDLL
jgi:hypothetical protein